MKSNWPLVIVGMQGWKDHVITKRIDRMERTGKLRVLGFVPDDELSFLYSGAAIFVFPSLYEGFGIPPLEAMASGIPVICANIPPMSKIIKNGGLTFKLNDSKDLSNKIIELLNNREQLAKLRQNGLEIVKDYSLKHIAHTYVEYIKEIKNLT